MKNRLFNLLLISTTLILASCQKNEFNPQGLPTIEFIEIAKGHLGGVGNEGIPESNFVITSQNELDQLYSKMNSLNNLYNQPNIDFEEFTVIGVFLEVKNNEYEVEIEEIVDNKNSIHVLKTEKELWSRVFTQPFHLGKIPKTEKEIIFE